MAGEDGLRNSESMGGVEGRVILKLAVVGAASWLWVMLLLLPRKLEVQDGE